MILFGNIYRKVVIPWLVIIVRGKVNNINMDMIIQRKIYKSIYISIRLVVE